MYITSLQLKPVETNSSIHVSIFFQGHCVSQYNFLINQCQEKAVCEVEVCIEM